ncbi:hypothetical protein IQ06DRAFT_300927 [Phaeosphaeriaceae sp. SRC1lsM3a]|nr:hypothetical protein IQ06DRAFT_300927 [Stagonospora sp. SRC1lsM3a]
MATGLDTTNQNLDIIDHRLSSMKSRLLSKSSSIQSDIWNTNTDLVRLHGSVRSVDRDVANFKWKIDAILETVNKDVMGLQWRIDIILAAAVLGFVFGVMVLCAMEEATNKREHQKTEKKAAAEDEAPSKNRQVIDSNP